MKRSVKINLAVLAVVIVAGAVTAAFFIGRGSQYIGKDRALDMALADLGVERRDVRDVDVDLERRGQNPYYEVDFELLSTDAGPSDVTYYIDAATGAVISWDAEGPTASVRIASVAPASDAPATAEAPAQAPSGNTAPQNSTAATGPVQAPERSDEPGGGSGTDTRSTAGGQYISRDDALAIALTDAGLTAAEAYDQDVDLELSRGVSPFYEVDFETASTDYKYYIDAVSGEILSSRVEAEGLGRPAAGGAQSGDYISREDAVAVALADAGLTQDQVYDLEAELDRDGGIVRYEVDFETASTEYKYDIDPVTGDILSSRTEPNR